ncbi:MAG: DUF1840 family protein [Pseudomonadota bacterium]
MPVTFSTPSHPRIMQLDHVARSLLRMMGQTDLVPGALRAENVAAAAEQLREALAAQAPPEDDGGKSSDSDSEPKVSSQMRAQPLLDLLDAAAARGDHVMWE